MASLPSTETEIVATSPKRRGPRAVRVALQAAVTIALFTLLGWLAVKYDVRENLRGLHPADVALGGGLFLLACAVNSFRARLLLANAGISRGWASLFGLYLIGLFFSTFLPSSGGDVVRIYDVARRSGRVAAAVVATIHERLFGLGVSMLIGLAASIVYFDRLPSVMRLSVVTLQILGPLALVLLLYPMTFARPASALWIRLPAGIRHSSLAGRAQHWLKSLAAVTPLSLTRLLAVTLVSIVGVLLTIAVYWTFGRSLGAGVGFGGFCLVVPLVWVIRMLPVSLGGLGVGEAAIVYLLGAIFRVDPAPATALAFATLAVQLGVALIGGIVLAARVVLYRAPER